MHVSDVSCIMYLSNHLRLTPLFRLTILRGRDGQQCGIRDTDEGNDNLIELENSKQTTEPYQFD